MTKQKTRPEAFRDRLEDSIICLNRTWDDRREQFVLMENMEVRDSSSEKSFRDVEKQRDVAFYKLEQAMDILGSFYSTYPNMRKSSRTQDIILGYF
jgi:hypothetical protein